MTSSAGADAQTRHYLACGIVQGVGFRWFVAREANALKLCGWVRNTHDGGLEVLARGAPPALDELERAMRRGPRGSHVETLTALAVQCDPVVKGRSFEVRQDG